MRGLVLITAALLCAFPSAARAAAGELMRIGAYIPEYRFGLDWNRAGSRATDLILFSVEPAADGTVAELGRLTTDALNAARAAREKHGTRLHVSIGGAGRSANFGVVAKNAELRKKFGMALLALAQVEKLDGLDFDWEAQIGNENNFAKLVRGIKKAARKRLPKLTVSVAGAPPRCSARHTTPIHSVSTVWLTRCRWLSHWLFVLQCTLVKTGCRRFRKPTSSI